MLATGGDDRFIRLWEVVEDRPVPQLPTYRSDVTAPIDELSRLGDAVALAELVTAKTAAPPLAVGLFGDWGDGKMFGDLYPDVSVPKNAGRWIASVQHHMAKAGEHRSASAIDLMIAATAAHHGLTVLHDDADYRTVARHAPDFREHNIRDVS